MSSDIFQTEMTDTPPRKIDGLAFAIGFFFSFRLGITLFSVHLLGVDASTGTAVSLCLDFLLLGLVCFDSVGATHRTVGSMLRIPSVRWVFIFLAFSCFSLMWSETASLSNSVIYWMGLATDVAIVVLLLRSGSTTTVAHSLMKGFLWSSCCLALVAWIMPAQADLRLGDEQFFNTNEIGNLCAFSIFFAQYLARRNDGKWRFTILFLVLTLLRSLSKTTIVAFVVSESVLLVRDRSIQRKTKVLLILLAISLVLAFWGLFEAYYSVYTTTGNQAETLTGRTAIWLYVVNAISNHPWDLWIGHGFDSWWKVVPPFGGERFEARHAENEILQQFYAYGIAGVVILAGIYGSLYRSLRKLQRGPVRILFLGFLLFILVRGLAEADAFDLLLPLWSIVLIAALVDCVRTKEAKALPPALSEIVIPL